MKYEITQAEREVLEHVAIALELADMLLSPIVPDLSEAERDRQSRLPQHESEPIDAASFFLRFAKLSVGRALNDGEEAFPTAYLSELFAALAQPPGGAAA